jgi:hypothetical protein
MYTVQPGDTLTKIAKKHNTRVEEILRANTSIVKPDKLKVGQRLVIPSSVRGFRPLSNGGSANGGVLEALRQGSAMFSTSFYSAYAQAMAYACTIFRCRSFDRERFYDAYKEQFKDIVLKNEHVAGLNKLLGFIERDPEMTNLKVAAYLLATVHHETGWPPEKRYSPTTEHGDKAYFNQYDPVLGGTSRSKNKAKELGNTAEGDGYKYRGRGYVQLTGKGLYKKCGDKFARDLVNNPDLAMEPKLSYNIVSSGMRTGLFTGSKIGEFIVGSVADYVNARQVINGLDKANDIAGYAYKFERIFAHSIEG